MNTLSLAAAAALIATPGIAEIVKVPAAGDVGATMDALESAVGSAGATVFARVDHAGGASAAGLELPASQLLVFGNPKLGTPAMRDDPLAGLLLPLRVLVYEDGEGKVWLAYERPQDMLGDLAIAPDAPYLDRMSGALAKLTSDAAGS